MEAFVAAMVILVVVMLAAPFGADSRSSGSAGSDPRWV